MKSVAATRKATQEAYDQILKAKKVLVPEQDPQYMKNPSDGKDIWGTMFTPYEAPKKPDHPTSTIRVPGSSLEKLKLLGFEAPIQGELFGWQHQTLGWRVTSILTHPTHQDSCEQDFHALAKDGVTYLGFIRCDPDAHELTENDKKKLGAIADKHPALAILVSYPVPDLNEIQFLCATQISCAIFYVLFSQPMTTIMGFVKGIKLTTQISCAIFYVLFFPTYDHNHGVC
jgi:hypothetical protein